MSKNSHTVSRRRFLQQSAAGALVLGAGMAGMAAITQRRKNILFIAVDDLKPLLGCYGHPQIKTPHIDALAARGMLFSNCHCQQAVCGPSRASLMTGLRPDRTGVWDLKTKMRDIHPDILTIPQHFRNHGYETVHYGKLFDQRCVDKKKDEPSWSRPYIGTWRLPVDKGAGEKPLPYMNPDRAPFNDDDVPDGAHADGAICSAAERTLTDLAGSHEPFFLGVGFLRPHLPFNAPKRYWDLYRREDIELAAFQEKAENGVLMAYHNSGELRGGYSGIPPGRLPDDLQRKLIHGYMACVSYIDALVGRLVKRLDREGLSDHTVICLWGDHGWHLGDHGMWCKHSNFEQATRSPLILVDPDISPAAPRTDAPVEFVDIFPSLCAAAGLPTPGRLDGKSLLPLFSDPRATIKPAAQSQWPCAEGMAYAVRDRRYRYVEYRKMKYREGEFSGPVIARDLFDYRNDPLETKNIAHLPEHAERLKTMSSWIRAGE